MEFKRPETFEDILKLQKHLDESIHSSRERTLEDIKLSLIAELIELNEILKLTDVKPLFGNKRAKTHWLVFIKE